MLATTVAQAGLALLSAELFETREQAPQRHGRARQRLRAGWSSSATCQAEPLDPVKVGRFVTEVGRLRSLCAPV